MDEVTPDDATTTITTLLNAANDIDDYNIEATPNLISADDTINVAAVGFRYAGGAISATNDSVVLRIKKATGGTVTESAAITPATTTYTTNANAAPRNYALVTYQNPDAAAWTKALLDTAQIGWRKSADSITGVVGSTLWLSVDYTPIERAVGVYFPYKSYI